MYMDLYPRLIMHTLQNFPWSFTVTIQEVSTCTIYNYYIHVVVITLFLYDFGFQIMEKGEEINLHSVTRSWSHLWN